MAPPDRGLPGDSLWMPSREIRMPEGWDVFSDAVFSAGRRVFARTPFFGGLFLGRRFRAMPFGRALLAAADVPRGGLLHGRARSGSWRPASRSATSERQRDLRREAALQILHQILEGRGRPLQRHAI